MISKSPLTVQFWLLGLDARAGLLQRRGFVRRPAPSGSSLYTFGPLSLHSSELTVQAGEDTLRFLRQRGLFTLNGLPLPTGRGLELCLPCLREHEAWRARFSGADVREEQFRAHRLPPPVRRNLALWRTSLGPGATPGSPLWTPPTRSGPDREAASPPYPAPWHRFQRSV